jgi:hypothetical protein
MTSDNIVAEDGPRTVPNAAFFRSPATLSKTFVQRQRSTVSPLSTRFAVSNVLLWAASNRAKQFSPSKAIHFVGGVDMMA